MKILFVSGTYPTPSRPAHGTFVREFVRAMAKQGNECTVIRPVRIFEKKYGPLPPFEIVDQANGNAIKVFYPKYISFSSKNLLFVHTGQFTQHSFNLSVFRVLRKLKLDPDIVYGHFLYPGGYSAIKVGEKLKIPSIARVGEGDFWTVEPFGFNKAQQHYRKITAVIANGSHIKKAIIRNLKIPPDKILVQPNGIDLAKFYPIYEKIQIRKKLGLLQNQFLVIFAAMDKGKSKGLEVIFEAFDKLKDDYKKNIGLIVLGRRKEEVPQREYLKFVGIVPHSQVPLWLNASDVFVLPTQIEGSPNSLLEAMACGLPVITAKGEHLDDIVDDEVALRINPTDANELKSAILRLYNEPELRIKLKTRSLEKIQKFDLDLIAKKLTTWMQELKEKSSCKNK